MGIALSMEILGEVERVIAERKAHPRDGSYVSSLLREGEDKILKKIGEEATELVIASKNAERGAVVSEATDLIFHVLVLLGYKSISLEEIGKEFMRRRRP